MINFDNAATSYPKPANVRKAVNQAILKYGGNSGRGGHILSINTSKALFTTREKIANFFDGDIENVVLTLNCTHSLNLAIKGIMRNGGHIITSNMEHNSVIRPIYSLSKQNKTISYSVAEVYPDDELTIKSFKKLITSDTKAIVCTIASNVTGQILPYKEIGKLCAEHNICFIADGAQACGVLPIKMTDGINILCTPGHKGLYGITGTGILISDGKYHIPSLIEGGTGSNSLELQQPDFLPDSLEAGTVNIIGSISVGAGMDYINSIGIERIMKHENILCERFINGLKKIDNAVIYRLPNCKYAPIVSFNIEGVKPEELSEYLSRNGFCLRVGFHCAALTHKNLGTTDGTIRFAPSIFNNSSEVDSLIASIKKFKNN